VLLLYHVAQIDCNRLFLALMRLAEFNDDASQTAINTIGVLSPKDVSAPIESGLSLLSLRARIFLLLDFDQEESRSNLSDFDAGRQIDLVFR
jgi:hypothetical protein